MPEPAKEELDEMISQSNLTQENQINLKVLESDMFLTKEGQLENWAKRKKVFSKSDVMEYGLRAFYIRADRTIRDLVSQGKIRRLNDRELELKGIKGNMAYYQWCEK